MNVSFIRQEPIVTIELTFQEADILRALLGGFATTHHDSEARRLVFGLWEALREAGVDSIDTYSDFFTGRPEVR